MADSVRLQPSEVARALLHRTEPSRAAAPFNAVTSVNLNGHRIAVGTQETFPGGSLNTSSLLYEFAGKGELVSSAIVDNSRLNYSEMEAQHLIAPGAMERGRAHLGDLIWLKRWSR
ncbi:MAG: hypothetical protein HY821_20110 [Acidobacteria bacterium]|nr:hypothetical protein [Acidobacteriota bacterium]